MSVKSCTIESQLAMDAVGTGVDVLSRLSSCILRAFVGVCCGLAKKGMRSFLWQYLWKISYPSLQMKHRPLMQLQRAQPGGIRVAGRQEKPFITLPLWHRMHTPPDWAAQDGRASPQLPAVREQPDMQSTHRPLGLQAWQLSTPTHPLPISLVPNPQNRHSPVRLRMMQPEQSFTQSPPAVWKVGSQTEQAETLSCSLQLGTVRGMHEASTVSTNEGSQRVHQVPDRQKRQRFGQAPAITTNSSMMERQPKAII